MKIFYINTDEFLKAHDAEFLQNYAEGREFKSQKRFVQFTLGRYLVKNAAKEVFRVEDTEIVIEDDKPRFKNASLYFSISHSKNFVAAAFDEVECALDIEEMKPRDFAALGERYGREFKSSQEFYEFWTEYEAGIKLHAVPCGKFSQVFQKNFMLTAVSVCEIEDITIHQFSSRLGLFGFSPE